MPMPASQSAQPEMMYTLMNVIYISIHKIELGVVSKTGITSN